MEEVEILGFRADERASKGITSAHVDDVIAGYKPDVQPAPIVIGHPTNDAPAHGVVSGLRRDGNKLFVKLRNVGQAIVDGVRNEQLIARSIAFWDPDHPSNPTPGKFALRHFGFLGAASPGIPNLGKLAFSADGATIDADTDPAPAVVYAAPATPIEVITEPAPATPPAPNPEPKMTEAEIQAAAAENARIAQANAAEAERLKNERIAFAATIAEARATAHSAAIDGLVTAGKLAPADKDALVKVFAAIAPAPVEFAAGDVADPALRLLSILGKGGNVTPGTGGRQSPTDPAPEFAAGSTDALKAAADAALLKANEGMAAAHKGAK